MIKIPTITHAYASEGKSDLFGNIWYTKNINFNEQGYIKLSSRSVAIQSEKDNSLFDIPISFGRYGSGFNVVTANKPWQLAISNTSVSANQDTDLNAPQMSQYSWGAWWQNAWHAVKDNNTTASLFSKTGSTWTDKSVSLTVGVTHPIEVFRSRNTMCLGNGNIVKQVDTSYATTGLTQLTIPSDFEIVGLSYSNNKLGIITKLSTTASSQNQEAYFFTWDGVSTYANQGFPVGSDAVLGMSPYKSTWIILTRKGEILKFNGGGFDTLFELPYYYFSAILGDSINRIAFGNIIQVQGDLIYVNTSNGFAASGTRKEVYFENYPAGILCYDPRVGLYHRYSPSISTIATGIANQANVNTTTGIITINSAIVPATGSQVMQLYDEVTQIGGIVSGTAYYVIRVTTSSFKLATTRQNALDGSYITLTSQGNTTSNFAFVTVNDYGASLIQNKVGGIGIVDKNTQVYDHLVFGGEYDDFVSNTTNYSIACMTAPQFHNRGYFVTSKIPSQNIEDIYQNIYIKYRPLKTNDKIVIKYKYEDIIGLPVTTPQIPNLYICTWTSDTTFTTQADLSAAYTYLQTSGKELECEIISGAGGGSMSQVTSISLATSTYTVTLTDSIHGAASGNYCNIILNNWKKLGELSSTDTLGWALLPIAKNSKAIKVKVELRGSETTIEELLIVNKTQIAV